MVRFRTILLLAALLPSEMQGIQAPASDRSRAEPGVPASALQRYPDDPMILGTLAGLRFRQGRLREAEALASRLVRLDPESAAGWEILAVIRYLRDDPRGALRAWSHGRPLVVRDIEVRIRGHSGASSSATATDGVGVSGIAAGRPLTLEGLVRGERRLRALPAAARARLEYRALSAGEAIVDGDVALRARNPFTGPGLIAHGFRLLGRSVHLVSANPLGHLERWEFDASVEGTLRSGTFALSHLAPANVGVWRWEVDHRVGRYGSRGHETAVTEQRTSIAWTHAHWLTARVQGSAHTRIDLRPGRGTLAGAGLGWTLLPFSERSAITAEGMGWMRIGGETSADGGERGGTRFGLVDLRASLHPFTPPAVGAPTGVAARFGVVAISSGLPPDLMPRIGSGRNVALLMRARSDLDSEGVVRPVFPGSAWIHGGVELLRPVRSVGPVGIGVAAFADAVRVLASDRRSVDPTARSGAVHLGAGIRVRIPAVDGWLRVDWAIDPADRVSRLSAGWVTPFPIRPKPGPVD